ncbi:hypothetical protein [Ottowia sp.]
MPLATHARIVEPLTKKAKPGASVQKQKKRRNIIGLRLFVEVKKNARQKP